MLPPEHLLALDSPPSFPCVFWVPERRGRLVSETRFIAEHRWANLDEGADVPQQKPKKMQKGRFSENAKASVPRSEVSGAHNQCNWAVCAVWSHIFLQIFTMVAYRGPLLPRARGTSPRSWLTKKLHCARALGNALLSHINWFFAGCVEAKENGAMGGRVGGGRHRLPHWRCFSASG